MAAGGDTLNIDAAPPADALSKSSAVRDAQLALKFLSKAAVTSATFALLTDHKYGPATDDANNTGPSKLLIVNRPVWIITFGYAAIPNMGPPGANGSEAPPEEGRMWVAVDAVDGTLVISRSL